MKQNLNVRLSYAVCVDIFHTVNINDIIFIPMHIKTAYI